MKFAAKIALVADDPEVQLRTFIDKFDAKDQALIRAVRKAMRKRLPAANELVYDNYNFFVIGYCPTERPTESILSVAARAGSVSLCFPYCGTRLPDPHKLLRGSGTQNRSIRIDSAETLARPEVEAFIAAAVSLTKPLPSRGTGKLIIRSVSAKQRPRRKTL
jgi:hypothetical protein